MPRDNSPPTPSAPDPTPGAPPPPPPRRHRLSDDDRSFVERLVESSNLTQAGRALRLPRQTVAALLATVGGVTEATITLARERIAEARAAR